MLSTEEAGVLQAPREAAHRHKQPHACAERESEGGVGTSVPRDRVHTDIVLILYFIYLSQVYVQHRRTKAP